MNTLSETKELIKRFHEEEMHPASAWKAFDLLVDTHGYDGEALALFEESVGPYVEVLPVKNEAAADTASAPVAPAAQTSKGVKFDQEKTRTDLLSPWALMGMAAVLTYGAKKYSANNWRKGLEYSRVLGAIMRHVMALMRGEDIDEDSGLPHIDCVLTEAMFLSEMQKLGFGHDDRFYKDGKKG